MSRIEKNKLNFTVALIAEFAATYQIKQKQAFNYLNRFKGLVFLQKHYEVMHTQSFEDSIEALSMVCRRNMEIDKPDLSRSKPFKDFGQGFYLSPGYEQAHALAKQKTDQLQSGEPCVTIFELEDQIIKTSDLQIKIFDDYCEEWAQFVLLNRDRSHTHPAHTYDIVIGPIADDGVTYQLRRYSMGDISMSRLIEELKYAKGLTIQYYFGTEHALSYLKKL